MTFKRIFDIAVASIALLLLIPLFLTIALAVKLDSRGSVFYKARRIGRGGWLFHMYKFRTMHVNADRVGPGLTYQDDPRITRVGRFLRKLRFDELPQLLNVLAGEMSLVGPRPEAPEYVRLDQLVWRQVLSVQPGICGLAQLTFAVDEAALLGDGASAADVYRTKILPAKLQLDLRYIYTRSLLFDLKLLFQTALLLIRQRRHAPLT
jgi:lipopolysaccharide/colanic/teichoic acid biosynthesis glycosyltransferase